MCQFSYRPRPKLKLTQYKYNKFKYNRPKCYTCIYMDA